jgi:hypothetical protein
MTLPKQTITVLDPGLGLVAANPNSPLVMGPSSLGTVNTLYSISSLNTIRSALGFGAGPEQVAEILADVGGPVLFMPINKTVSSSITAIVKSGAGPVITVTGPPNDVYTVRLKITKAGALGVGEFQFTCDYHAPTVFDPTWSKIRTIPAGGTFAIPNTGFTLTFPAGSYVLDETYDFSAIPATPNATDLSGGATPIIANTLLQFPLWGLAATFATATAASAMATALSGHLTTLATGLRFARGVCDAGSGDSTANVVLEAANWSSRRICAAYGYHYPQSALPFEGFSVRKVGAWSSLLSRAAGANPASDLARTADGPLERVKGIVYDGDDNLIDNVGISTLRRHAGQAGYWIGKGRLKSPIGSDFTDMQYGRVIDIGCNTVRDKQFPFLSDGFRTLDNGAIDPLDKADIEEAVNGGLVDTLISPKNARGRPGLVSEAKYTIDGAHNLNTTGQILTRTAIRPLGYANEFIAEIGFALNV